MPQTATPQEKGTNYGCMPDMGEPKNNSETLWETPDGRDYIMYDSIYMKLSIRTKSRSMAVKSWRWEKKLSK